MREESSVETGKPRFILMRAWAHLQLRALISEIPFSLLTWDNGRISRYPLTLKELRLCRPVFNEAAKAVQDFRVTETSVIR